MGNCCGKKESSEKKKDASTTLNVSGSKRKKKRGADSRRKGSGVESRPSAAAAAADDDGDQEPSASGSMAGVSSSSSSGAASASSSGNVSAVDSSRLDAESSTRSSSSTVLAPSDGPGARRSDDAKNTKKPQPDQFENDTPVKMQPPPPSEVIEQMVDPPPPPPPPLPPPSIIRTGSHSSTGGLDLKNLKDIQNEPPKTPDPSTVQFESVANDMAAIPPSKFKLLKKAELCEQQQPAAANKKAGEKPEVGHTKDGTKKKSKKTKDADEMMGDGASPIKHQPVQPQRHRKRASKAVENDPAPVSGSDESEQKTQATTDPAEEKKQKRKTAQTRRSGHRSNRKKTGSHETTKRSTEDGRNKEPTDEKSKNKDDKRSAADDATSLASKEVEPPVPSKDPWSLAAGGGHQKSAATNGLSAAVPPLSLKIAVMPPGKQDIKQHALGAHHRIAPPPEVVKLAVPAIGGMKPTNNMAAAAPEPPPPKTTTSSEQEQPPPLGKQQHHHHHHKSPLPKIVPPVLEPTLEPGKVPAKLVKLLKLLQPPSTSATVERKGSTTSTVSKSVAPKAPHKKPKTAMPTTMDQKQQQPPPETKDLLPPKLSEGTAAAASDQETTKLPVGKIAGHSAGGGGHHQRGGFVATTQSGTSRRSRRNPARQKPGLHHSANAKTATAAPEGASETKVSGLQNKSPIEKTSVPAKTVLAILEPEKNKSLGVTAAGVEAKKDSLPLVAGGGGGRPMPILRIAAPTPAGTGGKNMPGFVIGASSGGTIGGHHRFPPGALGQKFGKRTIQTSTKSDPMAAAAPTSPTQSFVSIARANSQTSTDTTNNRKETAKTVPGANIFKSGNAENKKN